MCCQGIMERVIARAGQERDPSYQFRSRLAARGAQGHPLALQPAQAASLPGRQGIPDRCELDQEDTLATGRLPK
jgi:hypothetical protein